MKKVFKACAFAAVLLALCVDDIRAEDFCQCEGRIKVAAKIDIDRCYVEKINSGVNRQAASIDCGMIGLEPQYSVMDNCGHLLTRSGDWLIAACKGDRWALPAKRLPLTFQR